ncbi:MAG: hypothetical protein ABJ239_10850 [Erythrobacter sp.]
MTRRSDPQTNRLPVPAGELPTFTPVPRQCQRHDGWTDERQQAFIETPADTGSVAAACKVVDMSTVGAYYLRRQPGAETFRKAWEAALQLGVQKIEDVAMDRALNGVDVPVYSYGKLVGLRKSYNDRLLMFMLRNRSPERFSEGRAKGLNGLDATRLHQEKQKWRKEWELERQAELSGSRDSGDVRASIDRKIEEIRTRVEADQKREWESLSDEAKEAIELAEQLRQRDLNGPTLLENTNRSATSGPQGRPAAAPTGAQPSEADASRPAPEGPKQTRRLTDDNWD